MKIISRYIDFVIEDFEERIEDISEDTLSHLAQIIKEAYTLGLGSAIDIVEGGSFLHDKAPGFKFSKEVSSAIDDRISRIIDS